jgi:hypothetical protein
VLITKRLFAYGAAFLLSAGLYAAGCNDTVTAKDCSANCQDIDNTCVKNCTDDACKTRCQTDLDNCSASCGTITISPPSDAGAGQ